jgi:hypothetical protein
VGRRWSYVRQVVVLGEREGEAASKDVMMASTGVFRWRYDGEG